MFCCKQVDIDQVSKVGLELRNDWAPSLPGLRVQEDIADGSRGYEVGRRCTYGE